MRKMAVISGILGLILTTALVITAGVVLARNPSKAAAVQPRVGTKMVRSHRADVTGNGVVPPYVGQTAQQFATEMGDPSPTSVQAVLTTRGAAEWLDGEGVDEPQTPVWFVEMAGSFVDRFARIPPGASYPTGTAVDFTIDTRTHETLDLGVSDTLPDLSQLGRVYSVPIPAGAQHYNPFHTCSGHTIYDRPLGICVRLSKGLVRSTKLGTPPQIVIVRAYPMGGSELRATINGLEMAPGKSLRSAIRRAATDVLTGWPHSGPTTQSWGQVGGAPALFLDNVQFAQNTHPDTIVLFAYHKPSSTSGAAGTPVLVAYLPGREMTPDQKAIISSIFFIPRTQTFECATAPYLSIQPNPVRVRRSLSIALTCAAPNHMYSFAAYPVGSRGHGAPNVGMGGTITGPYGMAIFKFPGFNRSDARGMWQVRAFGGQSKQTVATRWLWVRGS